MLASCKATCPPYNSSQQPFTARSRLDNTITRCSYLRHASGSDESYYLLPVTSKPEHMRSIRPVAKNRTACHFRHYEVQTHLSIASRNFSCSCSFQRSLGFVILYGLRVLVALAVRMPQQNWFRKLRKLLTRLGGAGLWHDVLPIYSCYCTLAPLASKF